MKKNQEKEMLNNKQPDTEYLTRKEAAIYLRLSLSKFDQIKEIDRIKYGKSVRFSIKALREYVIRHTIRGTEYV